MRKFTLILLLLLGTIVSAHAQHVEISGRIQDENSQPVAYANITLQRTDSTFVSGSTSDEKGRFTLKNLPADDYLLKVSFVGYVTQIIRLEDADRKLDLGNIPLMQDAVALQGVTVTGSNVTNRIDRQIIVPSARQVRAATSGYELLSHMQLPGLKVNNMERTVSTVSGGGVKLKINDIDATTAQVQALRPQEVVRVEYIDNPGMRYADDASIEAVINYVVRQREAGVSGGFNLMNAVTTGFGNDNVYVRANHKQSEFGLNYYVSYRHYDERFIDEDQWFDLPDGKRERHLQGISTPFNYADHQLELSYNLTLPDKVVFNAVFSDNIYDNPHNGFGQRITETGKDDRYSFRKADYLYNAPSLDLYTKVTLPHEQALAFNVVGTYINSEYNYGYSESLTEGGTPLSEYGYSTDGKRYSLIGEGVYRKNFKHIALSGGLKYTLAYTDNRYQGQVNETDGMHSSDLYGYAQVNGKWKRLNYMVGAGVSRQSYKESGQGYTYYMFRPMASLSCRLFEGATLRYVFSSSPSYPSLSSLSDIRQQLTDLEVRRGNAGLNPYRSYSNSLQMAWGNRWLNLRLTGRYVFSDSPIMEQSEQVEQPDGSYIFEYSMANQDRYSRLGGQLYASVNILPDRLSVSLHGGVNRFESKGDIYSHRYTSWYGGGNISFSYRNFSAIGAMSSRYNSLYGESIDYGEESCSIECSYRIKNLNIGAGMLYPFRSMGWSGGTKLLNDKVRKESWTHIKDNGNMLVLTLSWNFNRGKKHNAENKVFNNVDRDTGIAM